MAAISWRLAGWAIGCLSLVPKPHCRSPPPTRHWIVRLSTGAAQYTVLGTRYNKRHYNGSLPTDELPRNTCLMIEKLQPSVPSSPLDSNGTEPYGWSILPGSVPFRGFRVTLRAIDNSRNGKLYTPLSAPPKMRGAYHSRWWLDFAFVSCNMPTHAPFDQFGATTMPVGSGFVSRRGEAPILSPNVLINRWWARAWAWGRERKGGGGRGV